MAKRDRRRGGASKSKAGSPRKPTAKRASLPQSSPSDDKPKLATAAAPAASPRPSNSAASGRAGRQLRTPLPAPISGDLEEIHLGGAKARRRRAGAGRATAAMEREKRSASASRGAASRGGRTALPAPIAGELEEINLGGARSRANRRRRGGGDRSARGRQRRQRAADQGARFQHLQDYLHNPNLFDLRGQALETSSTPEEIEARTGEVRYQIEVIRSLMTVLTEELKTLEKARPRSGRTAPSQS